MPGEVRIVAVGLDVAPHDLDLSEDVRWVVVVDPDDEFAPIAVIHVDELAELVSDGIAAFENARSVQVLRGRSKRTDRSETDLGLLRIRRDGTSLTVLGPSREIAIDYSDLPGRPVTPTLVLRCRPYHHVNHIDVYVRGMPCVIPEPKPHPIGI